MSDWPPQFTIDETPMTLTDETRQRIEDLVREQRVMLFMKGTPQQPMCGFSAQTVGLLEGLTAFASFNVLEDPEIREGIKVYGNWPTIPQLYIDGELVGGCDIVTAMFNSGELHEHLGIEAPDRTPPEITITDKAAEKIREAMNDPSVGDELGLHFRVDAGWQSAFTLAPVEGNEIVSESNGLKLHFDINSAQRARGATIDWVESMQGEGLSVKLPEAPSPVEQIEVTELKQRLDDESIIVIDVRSDEERGKAPFEGAWALTPETMDKIDALPKDTALAFLCHHGNRSQGAADHYRKAGYENVYNVAGGIDAWSEKVDPSVPKY